MLEPDQPEAAFQGYFHADSECFGEKARDGLPAGFRSIRAYLFDRLAYGNGAVFAATTAAIEPRPLR